VIRFSYKDIFRRFYLF